MEEIESLIKAIPWASWVKWVAMDKNSSWFGYQNKPVISGQVQWNFSGRYFDCIGLNLPTHPDWTKSLIKVND